MAALDGTLLLLDVCAVDLVEQEGEPEGDDIREFMLHLLVENLVRGALLRARTQRLAQDHYVSHEALEFFEPLLDDLLRVALH